MEEIQTKDGDFCLHKLTFLIPQEAHAALDAYLHSHLSHWMYSYITKAKKSKHKTTK